MIKKVFIQEKILEIVRGQPGISAPKLAELLGMSRISAYTYLKSLIDLQKVRIQGQGKATRYFPHESLYIGTNIATGA